MKKAFASLLAKKRGKKGFTLVELVIVIAVLAIIAGIAVPTVHNVVENANHAADQSNCQAVELALKTAASEIQAKNGTNLTKDSTVSEVLKENGIGEAKKIGSDTFYLPPTLKTSDYEWQYDPDTGKIYVIGAPSGSPELTYQTKLSAIFTDLS